MKGVYVQENSPYYWLRYYDKLEHNPNRKRKSVNTKISVTPADQRRIETARKNGHKAELQGTPELRKLVREFKTGLAQRNIESTAGIKLRHDLTLSEGYAEFKRARTVPGSKKELKEKTLINYGLAVSHFIKACGDKKIYKYTDKKDYVALLFYFEQLGLSANSRSIYSRTLKSLWNYFTGQNYAAKNIIEPVDPEIKDPDPIPPHEMYLIIQALKEDKRYPHHYWIVYNMLLTAGRPSSSILQLKEDINFKQRKVKIPNVKTGKRKKKPYYWFPLFNELKKLYEEMRIKPGDKGRIFNMFSVVPLNYTYPLSFWERKIKFLYSSKKISKKYKLKQLRPTFITFMIEILKMDIYTVFKLADHANIDVTDKHYIGFKTKNARKILDEMSLENFLDVDDD